MPPSAQTQWALHFTRSQCWCQLSFPNYISDLSLYIYISISFVCLGYLCYPTRDWITPAVTSMRTQWCQCEPVCDGPNWLSKTTQCSAKHLIIHTIHKLMTISSNYCYFLSLLFPLCSVLLLSCHELEHCWTASAQPRWRSQLQRVCSSILHAMWSKTVMSRRRMIWSQL